MEITFNWLVSLQVLLYLGTQSFVLKTEKITRKASKGKKENDGRIEIECNKIEYIIKKIF